MGPKTGEGSLQISSSAPNIRRSRVATAHRTVIGVECWIYRWILKWSEEVRANTRLVSGISLWKRGGLEGPRGEEGSPVWTRSAKNKTKNRLLRGGERCTPGQIWRGELSVPPTPVTYSADAGGCDSIAYVKALASSVLPASPSTTQSPLAVGLSITMDNWIAVGYTQTEIGLTNGHFSYIIISSCGFIYSVYVYEYSEKITINHIWGKAGCYIQRACKPVTHSLVVLYFSKKV